MVPASFSELTGKTAVVTGASSGIGRAIAQEFAIAGATVLIHYHQNLSGARQLQQKINAEGGKAELIQADLKEEKTCENFVNLSCEKIGEVDIWVNNAGADLLTGAGRYLSYSEKLHHLWEVDVKTTVTLSRKAGEHMKSRSHKSESPAGVILNIGWDQAERGMEGDSGELFATAKNAIMGFTRSLALTLAPQVRVNCIAPGWIKTAWGESAGPIWQERVLRETPLQRWGKPEDIAHLARFLVSDEANYLTGQVIYANGGAVR